MERVEMTNEAALRLLRAMLAAAETDARHYRGAWLSARRRAHGRAEAVEEIDSAVTGRDQTPLPDWIMLHGLSTQGRPGTYWTAHCLHEPCPTGFYAQGGRQHVEDEAAQHVRASHGSET
ncbi:MAG TPA: hypothetical protein VF642_12435 [Propionibacteriaceae bacterium]|jgi:hypothetical protein